MTTLIVMLCMYVYYLMSLLLALVYTKTQRFRSFPRSRHYQYIYQLTLASGKSIDWKKNGTIELYY